MTVPTPARMVRLDLYTPAVSVQCSQVSGSFVQSDKRKGSKEQKRFPTHPFHCLAPHPIAREHLLWYWCVVRAQCAAQHSAELKRLKHLGGQLISKTATERGTC